jgi:hypothetical protein
MESDQFEPEFILVLPRIKGITQFTIMVVTKVLEGNWK